MQPVMFTEGAVKALKGIEAEQDIPKNYGLRVGVKGGGCSGFSYVLGFDEQTEKDDVFEIEGIRVLIEKTHFMYLAGMEIDWVDGLENRGFSFNNPNAKSTCGCGSSFEV
ncbi:MAG TPA: iron-sulfur cluster assembly accessory protein [Bacteroidetes bacterium]|nr:iron-sulfur cluster assembly accessory protein [Bacteroidota bacterium]